MYFYILNSNEISDVVRHRASFFEKYHNVDCLTFFQNTNNNNNNNM